MEEDLYKILEVDKTASVDDIKKSYRNLSKKYHPDMPTGDKERFQKISNAYETLSDPAKRQHYDRFGTTGGNNTGGFGDINIEDLFSMFNPFGGGHSHGQRRRVVKGQNHRVTVNLSITDILNGSDHKIKYNRKEQCGTCSGTGGDCTSCSNCKGSGVVQHQQRFGNNIISSQKECDKCNGAGEVITKPCNTCNGSGCTDKEHLAEFNLPANILGGMVMNIDGAGNYTRNGEYGDLEVHVKETSHPKWKRVEQNIIIEHSIPMIDFVLGAEIELDTPHGKMKYDVKPDNKPIKTFIKAKGGIAPIDNYGRSIEQHKGNMIVNISPKIPVNLTNEEKDILYKLKESKNFQ